MYIVHSNNTCLGESLIKLLTCHRRKNILILGIYISFTSYKKDFFLYYKSLYLVYIKDSPYVVRITFSCHYYRGSDINKPLYM